MLDMSTLGPTSFPKYIVVYSRNVLFQELKTLGTPRGYARPSFFFVFFYLKILGYLAFLKQKRTGSSKAPPLELLFLTEWISKHWLKQYFAGQVLQLNTLYTI